MRRSLRHRKTGRHMGGHRSAFDVLSGGEVPAISPFSPRWDGVLAACVPQLQAAVGP